MNYGEIINNFWSDIAKQDKISLVKYFFEDATIYWHNTNEKFNVKEFIRANCEYPGNWKGEVERVEMCNSDEVEQGDCSLMQHRESEIMEKTIVSVARVWCGSGDKDENSSFHATSFFHFKGDKIQRLDEYWGDDGTAPKWRISMEIGNPIKWS